MYSEVNELWPHKSNETTVLALDSHRLDKLYPVS